MSGNDYKPTLVGKIKDKLIASKQQWAKDGRLLTGEKDAPQLTRRLPPGQRQVRDWPVLDLGVQPNILLDKWQLSVGGLVANPVKLDWNAFLDLPQTETLSDIHCVTAWSRYDNHWAGVRTVDLLKLVKPRPEAKFVVFQSYDGYATNVTLEHFSAPDVLLAHSWEGAPITREHGGPVRVVMPRWYFWKSAKWVKHIAFLDRDAPGYWEVRGYHNEGDPWKEDRYG
ncbi:sulfite oxidase-like oxidoreductase [Ferrovibrio sp. MS7]|jgi:DMSO/TMAO reductase YedYZ molybdopterin-dependent catalytic subunit|uniref:sulfite oxidase-like oxidoreductase n=1 Tax=Ferrovibrio TaxID=1231242 RepID=UPI001B60177A|nr:sulfite oxidase-like oxidoreductase [Ferrovibrio sp.]